jgi:hypothetical protein
LHWLNATTNCFLVPWEAHPALNSARAKRDWPQMNADER